MGSCQKLQLACFCDPFSEPLQPCFIIQAALRLSVQNRKETKYVNCNKFVNLIRPIARPWSTSTDAHTMRFHFEWFLRAIHSGTRRPAGSVGEVVAHISMNALWMLLLDWFELIVKTTVSGSGHDGMFPRPSRPKTWVTEASCSEQKVWRRERAKIKSIAYLGKKSPDKVRMKNGIFGIRGGR